MITKKNIINMTIRSDKKLSPAARCSLVCEHSKIRYEILLYSGESKGYLSIITGEIRLYKNVHIE